MIRTISKKYDLIAESDTNKIKLKPVSVLFSNLEYLQAVSSKSLCSFYIYDKIKSYILGIIRFQIDDDTATSLVNAPFGSVILNTQVEFEILDKFIRFFTEYLFDSGVSRIIINHYPWIYNPIQHDKIVSAYGLSGFNVGKVDISHYVQIDSDSLISKLHRMEKRKLSKCKKEGFLFKEHHNKDLNFLFTFIKSFRIKRNIPLNIDLQIIEALISKLPDHYKLFSLNSGNDLIACTIAVKASKDVLYNFLPAHNPKYDAYSPMVYLLEKIYEYAGKHQFKYLDLGISSINNKPQPDLIKFKERMGGITASKFSFLKNL